MRKGAKKDNLDHITRIYNRHKDKDIFILGTGPSLLGFDWTRMNGRLTIALNDAVRAQEGFVPRYHLFSDGNLYEPAKSREQRNPLGGYRKFKYDPITDIICGRHQRILFIRHRPAEWPNKVWQFCACGAAQSMQENDNHLFVNRTVATGAICLAWKLGAKRIFILGVDGYKLRMKDGKEVYYHNGTPKPPERRKEMTKEFGEHVKVIQTDRHSFWVRQMDELKKRLNVLGAAYDGPWPARGIYNLSKDSEITAWQKVDQDAAL
jgi:hypothetical protein